MSMETKIIKLVTGEELVCKLVEQYNTDKIVIGFKVIFPYRVVLMPTNGSNAAFDINYLAWMSSCSDYSFDISLPSVIAMGNPVPEVEQMYLERYEEFVMELNSKKNESKTD
jgi:hypothetical protein